MKFVVIEDESKDMDEICAILEEFEGSEIIRCNSESSFQGTFPSIAAPPPDLVIIDVMVHLATPGASVFYTAPNPEYREGGFRCLDILRGHPAARDVDVILHSVLLPDQWPKARRSLGKHDFFVHKGSPDQLRRHIRSLRPNLRTLQKTLAKRIWDAVSVRMGPVTLKLKDLFSRK